MVEMAIDSQARYVDLELNGHCHDEWLPATLNFEYNSQVLCVGLQTFDYIYIVLS